MPFVFNDSATCPSLVFLPEVPTGVVPMAIALMMNPNKLNAIEIIVMIFAEVWPKKEISVK